MLFPGTAWFDPDRGLSEIILWNKCREASDSYLRQAGFLLHLMFGPEDGGDMFLRNVSLLSTDYAVLYPRKYSSSLLLLWEPQILPILFLMFISRDELSRKKIRHAHIRLKEQPRRWRDGLVLEEMGCGVVQSIPKPMPFFAWISYKRRTHWYGIAIALRVSFQLILVHIFREENNFNLLQARFLLGLFFCLKMDMFLWNVVYFQWTTWCYVPENETLQLECLLCHTCNVQSLLVTCCKWYTFFIL
jgi:hypothetical protein